MKTLQTKIVGYLPEGDMHGRYIWTAIREGLWPFKPRYIKLFLEYDIDYNRHVLFAEAWFPDYLILKRVDMSADDLYDDLDGTILKAANEMLKKFRDREDFALAPLIHLGEN